MRRLFLHRSVSALALLCALAPAAARAQDGRGFFIGGGLGVETIGQQGTGGAHVSSEIGIHTGYRFTPGAALMLESAVHGMDAHVRGDSSAAFVPGDVLGATAQRPLTTSSLLLSLQLGVAAGWYVRPGLGFGAHSYTVYEPIGDGLYVQRTGHEGGPAAQLAVGRALDRPGTIGIEALGLYSHGEDSTSPRWAAGVQLTYDLRF